MSSVFNICGGENNSFTPAPKPNRVETITGTLAQPFGDYDIDNLGAALYSNNVSIVLQGHYTRRHGYHTAFW